jgi:hypothetical protein
MFKILQGDEAMLNMVLRKLPDKAALSSESLKNTNALMLSASRTKPSVPGSGRRGATGDVVDAETAALVVAIDNF